MKFWKIFNLEFNLQLRQLMTWLAFVGVFAIAFLTIWGNYSDDSRGGYFLLNAPIVIAEVTAISSLFWLLMSASVAGEAAARDTQTRMFSLTYTSPVSRMEYLGGRFFAAFVVNTIILLAIPIGILLALYATGMEKELLGPFRLDSYLAPFFLIAVPNVFIATAIQFSAAALTRRVMMSYLVGVVLFIFAFVLGQFLRKEFGMPVLGKLLDPIYLNGTMAQMSIWTPFQRNTRFMNIDNLLWSNRLIWLIVALAMSALAYFRFRFSTPAAKRTAKPKRALETDEKRFSGIAWGQTESLPKVKGVYGFDTHLHQLKRITRDAFLSLAKGWSGVVILFLIALAAALAMPGNLKDNSVPLLARADQILRILVAPMTSPGKFTIMICLLTIFYAGELVWRERESGLSELANAAPVPNWVLFLSNFFSLALMMVIALVFFMLAGICTQIIMGDGGPLELHLYVQMLFGFQLVEFILFAMLVLVVHTLVNQKYIGHLAAIGVFALMMFAPILGVQHKLLIFGSSPPWSYTDMGGFGESVLPWLWFRGYWTAWVVLFAVVAVLLAVRGREDSLIARLKLARGRITGTTLLISSISFALILGFGGFIFYNTNILNQYPSSAMSTEARAGYEKRYGMYIDAPQPSLTDVNFQAEIYPEEGEFTVEGSYTLVNKQSVALRSILIANAEGGETKMKELSRASKRIFDQEFDVSRYDLQEPLAPGDTVRLDFSLHYQIKGFTNDGRDSLITSNFTSFRNIECMPVIGYQQYKEIDEPGLRKKYGLAPRPATASLYNLKARNYAPFAERVFYSAIIGTTGKQMAVAPGRLWRTWNKGDRRYFHYVTDSPIRNEYAVYSANYVVFEQQWTPPSAIGKPVLLQIYHHPGQESNVPRIARSMKAALEYYSKEFGPYPNAQLRIIARPGHSSGNHASPATISAGEGFFVLNPEYDERGFDLVTAVVAHEVAHQWWGNQFKSAYIEGAGLLSESLAWYSAMGMLEERYGPEHLQKLLSFMRETYETPRSKAALPLLQANDKYLYYRKGPFALYALSKYVGKDKINGVLHRLVEKYPLGKLPMPTSLDLYAGIKEVMPDSLQYLVDDLFKKNIFWELSANQAVLKETTSGYWEVSFTVNARKLRVDQNGLEKEIPLRDWIEIGVFAAAKAGEEKGSPLYLKKHFLTATKQTITITVPGKPALAGIDPNYLLVDWNTMDNVVKMKK